MPFDGGKDEVNLACSVTQQIDEWQIERYRLPALYETGIRWQREGAACNVLIPGSCERFLTAKQCIDEYRAGLKLGFDCDDLGPWRAAELRLVAQGRAPWLKKYGGDIYAQAAGIRSPGIGWHVVVLGKGGRILEDPSAKLGMHEALRKGT